MKPTKEIIELSRKLHDLGVRKEPELGDWYIVEDAPYLPYLLWGERFIEDFERYHKQVVIVIPPLEWCLEWLLGYGDLEVSMICQDKEWSAIVIPSLGSTEEWIREDAPTPDLAVLKAMLAVKTAK